MYTTTEALLRSLSVKTYDVLSNVELFKKLMKEEIYHHEFVSIFNRRA